MSRAYRAAASAMEGMAVMLLGAPAGCAGVWRSWWPLWGALAIAGAWVAAGLLHGARAARCEARRWDELHLEEVWVEIRREM